MRSIEQLRNILIMSPNPIERLNAVLELRQRLFASGDTDAANEILETIKNDTSGEVVIGTAFACRNPPQLHASKFRDATMKFFEQSGDMSTSNGTPLLRLAYIATFENDVATLKTMLTKRDKYENGMDSIQEIAEALASNNTNAIYQIIAWREGLDAQFQPQFFSQLRGVIAGTDTLLQGLQNAVEYIRRTQQHR